jgi:DNA-binding transcriptional ArsR family regulator
MSEKTVSILRALGNPNKAKIIGHLAKHKGARCNQHRLSFLSLNPENVLGKTSRCLHCNAQFKQEKKPLEN